MYTAGIIKDSFTVQYQRFPSTSIFPNHIEFLIECLDIGISEIVIGNLTLIIVIHFLHYTI